MGGRKTDQGHYKIGSSTLGKIDFSTHDHFFHLDSRLQRLKRQVKESADPDILSLRKTAWNPSSSTEPPPREDHRKNLFNIRAGLADAKIALINKKAQCPGCDELRSGFAGKESAHARVECQQPIQSQGDEAAGGEDVTAGVNLGWTRH